MQGFVYGFCAAFLWVPLLVASSVVKMAFASTLDLGD